MKCSDLMMAISQHLPAAFACDAQEEYPIVTTPFIYPDGDQIDIAVMEKPGQGRLVLTDLGETIRHLASYGVYLDMSPRRQSVVENICMGRRVHYHRGQFAAVVSDLPQLAERLMILGQTIVQVSDLVYTGRGHSGVSFKDDVRDALMRIPQLSIVPNPRVHTIKKIPHRVDFQVTVRGFDRYIKALSSYSRGAANIQVATTVRLWDFLRRRTNLEQHHLLTVIDDTVDVWEREWIDQLSAHSTVLTWANERDKLPAALGA